MAVSTKPPTGTRDFLPAAVAERRYVTDIVEAVYRGYGFLPLETPAIENLSTLLGKYGDEGDQLIFRLLHRGAKLERALARGGDGATIEVGQLGDLGLRYDLTVPLARVVAQYGSQLPRFLRRYQIQSVWRADRPARGRYREFTQCDADVIGTTSLAVEAELLAAVCTIFDRLGFVDYAVRLNHRAILAGLMRVAGVPAERESEALVAIDKLDKIGEEGVLAELTERGIAETARAALAPIIAGPTEEIRAEARSVIAWLREQLAGDDGGTAGVDDLARVVELTAAGPAGPRIRVDPSLARGLSYYTGPIFEITAPDLAGSLGGGGRYDGLIGMFQRQPVPACGVSLGLERILVLMAERGMFPALAIAPQVMITQWSADFAAPSIALAETLRAAGLRVELYPEPSKPGKQLKYAGSQGIPLAVILAPDEAARGVCQLKDLRAGEQHEVRLEEVAARARALLG